MLKFFRKIRHKLLVENKFSRYLLYAVGEIVLVVIGILIALQINTWNENRINKNKEAAIINDLQQEFQKFQSAQMISRESASGRQGH